MSAHGGINQFDSEPADDQLLAQLNLACAQWVPDPPNVIVIPPIGSFYRPFCTTKESRAEDQPYSTPGGKMILWNGRLDNRDELSSILYGSRSFDQSDVAIVAAAYDRWGRDCLTRLIGDWAIAVWDSHSKTLDLAVDYIGVRQLYYCVTNVRLIWCTHLEPIVLAMKKPLTVNDEYIAGYLALHPDAELSPYCEIQTVPPGQVVRVNNGHTSVHSYWTFSSIREVRYKTDAEYEDHFRYSFRRAVKRRLRSDSPVLAELSGGLDSSSIVCMAHDIWKRGEAETPSIGTVSYYSLYEPGGDERPYFTKVEEVCEKVGCHINVDSTGGSFSLAYPHFLPFPGWLNSKATYEHEIALTAELQGDRVLLSGIGGDELLGGIPNPRPLLADLIVRFRPVDLSKELMNWSLVKRVPMIHLLFQALLLLLPNRFQISFTREAKVDAWVGHKLIRNNQFAVKQIGLANGFRFRLPSFRDRLQSVIGLRRQMGFTLPSSVPRFERTYPYLDRTLVEFLISIPATQLLRPGERRSLMRRALSGKGPPEVLSRKTKAGNARAHVLALEQAWPDLDQMFQAPARATLGYISAKPC